MHSHNISIIVELANVRPLQINKSQQSVLSNFLQSIKNCKGLLKLVTNSMGDNIFCRQLKYELTMLEK